eukprot:CAMPEP_0176124828 /NCGR_PEP_ID=MMETSP0120_2-20121206/62953_1 /TAXON_ID=160619 /ORGANISM="Kryptoperidinium foliaceum, Strain CCMP 1326" /LENGTH=88 /DNA_ID=CAMNT_0017459639 /DNA_START=35 /DNA_END=297 /DNA_ORIENTATION=-
MCSRAARRQLEPDEPTPIMPSHEARTPPPSPPQNMATPSQHQREQQTRNKHLLLQVQKLELDNAGLEEENAALRKRVARLESSSKKVA